MNTNKVKPEVSMDTVMKFLNSKTNVKTESELKLNTDEELEKKYNKCNFERLQYLEKYNLCKLEYNYEDLHQGRYIYGIFHMIMVIIAVYLSFRCNNKEFNVGSVLIAFFFPYIYIIYILATQGTCGILEK